LGGCKSPNQVKHVKVNIFFIFWFYNCVRFVECFDYINMCILYLTINFFIFYACHYKLVKNVEVQVEVLVLFHIFIMAPQLVPSYMLKFLIGTLLSLGLLLCLNPNFASLSHFTPFRSLLTFQILKMIVICVLEWASTPWTKLVHPT
jgi:hypothetical protein